MKLTIKESFDKSLPDWLKKEFKDLYGRTHNMRNYGLPKDLAGGRGNTNRHFNQITPSEVVYEEIPDYNLPRTAREFKSVAGYGEGTDTVIHYVNGSDDVVWIYGKTNPSITDPRTGARKSIDSIPLKYIIPNIVHMGRINWTTNRTQTRANRRNIWNQVYGDDSWIRYDDNGYDVDKSGYHRRGLEPYRSKLGARKLEQHSAIIDSAVESLNELRSMYDNVRNDSGDRSKFITAVRNMSELISTATRISMENNYRTTQSDYDNRSFLDIVRKLEKAQDFCEQMVYDIIHGTPLKGWNLI